MLSDEEIEAFKQEHGDIVMITLPAHNGSDPQQLLFRRAVPKVWADYQESITKDPSKQNGTNRRLSYACVVHPSNSKELEEVFARYPALPTKIASAISNISGVGDEFEVKKL